MSTYVLTNYISIFGANIASNLVNRGAENNVRMIHATAMVHATAMLGPPHPHSSHRLEDYVHASGLVSIQNSSQSTVAQARH
jgi:hypothetical protein